MTSHIYDVAIIGGGVNGLSTAYHLVNQRIDTLVLEQFPLLHLRGSSHGQSRIIRHAYKDTCYTQLMVDAFTMWHQLEQETGSSFLVRCGQLDIFFKNDINADKTANNLKELCVPYERLRGVEISRRFPAWKNMEDCEAILDKTGGMLLADKCMKALLLQIVHGGGVIKDGVVVNHIDPESPNSIVLVTNKGIFQARKLVIAAGSWTPTITSQLRLYLPITAVKTCACYWKEVEKGYHNVDTMPTFIDHRLSVHFYGLPSYEYPGLVKICLHGQVPTHQNESDTTNTQTNIRVVREYIDKSMTGLQHEQPCIIENCLYAMTPDKHFIIDKHPLYKNIVIGAGMSGHGFKTSIVVGKILADLVTNVTPKYDISSFRISRFPTTHSQL